MKLLVTSLLVFSLNVNLLAKPTAFQERAVKMIFLQGKPVFSSPGL
jgi:hypothetical protein